MYIFIDGRWEFGKYGCRWGVVETLNGKEKERFFFLNLGLPCCFNPTSEP